MDSKQTITCVIIEDNSFQKELLEHYVMETESLTFKGSFERGGMLWCFYERI